MKKGLLLILTALLFYTCKDTVTPDSPAIVNLIFPFENSECNVGTDSTDTESTVMFEWEASRNTDEYELNVIDLSTGDSTANTTTALNMPVRLKRATPYAWYVVSKSNATDKTTQSDTWKFYNAGLGITNYAPFPAEIVSPTMAETITTTLNVISLIWSGSDVDDDIAGYDVYFGTADPPGILETDFQENTLSNVPITANTVYYWKIVTKDTRGNTSDSGTYQFKIN